MGVLGSAKNLHDAENRAREVLRAVDLVSLRMSTRLVQLPLNHVAVSNPDALNDSQSADILSGRLYIF